jgi:hypothetical protein
MQVKTEEGKIKDVELTEVSPENYIVPEKEQHLYHCVIEIKKFDPENGYRLSKPRVQKFGVKAFDNVSYNLKKQGYTVTILHNPADFLKAQAAENEKAKIEKAAAAKAAADEAISIAVENALKAQAAENEKAIEKAVVEALAKATKTEKNK